MRYDINILWIDDTPTWQKEEQEIFQLNTNDYGLLTNITYVENIQSILDSIKNEVTGFKIYDIIFVDYNISSTLFGDEVIDLLRKSEIDADILFYSANNKNDIKKIIINKDRTFEGIYIANRTNFQEKAVMIYKKNIRNLLSISNIRGFLTEKTSENDFIMHSYLLKKFDNLTVDNKIIFEKRLKYLISENIKECSTKIESANKLLEKGDLNIKNILKLSSFILPIKEKYELLDMILKLLEENVFNKNTISEYFEKIVNIRNKIAHKKLDICKQQQFIKYYDNIDQYIKNQCSDDCSLHTIEGKISINDWDSILKLANEYSKLFNQIFSTLIQEEEATA